MAISKNGNTNVFRLIKKVLHEIKYTNIKQKVMSRRISKSFMSRKLDAIETTENDRRKG